MASVLYFKCLMAGMNSCHKFTYAGGVKTWPAPCKNGPGAWVCNGRAGLNPHFEGIHLAHGQYLLHWFLPRVFVAEHTMPIQKAEDCLVTHKARLLAEVYLSPEADGLCLRLAEEAYEVFTSLVIKQDVKSRLLKLLENARQHKALPKNYLELAEEVPSFLTEQSQCGYELFYFTKAAAAAAKVICALKNWQPNSAERNKNGIVLREQVAHFMEMAFFYVHHAQYIAGADFAAWYPHLPAVLKPYVKAGACFPEATRRSISHYFNAEVQRNLLYVHNDAPVF